MASFYAPASEEAVRKPTSHGMARTEVKCSQVTRTRGQTDRDTAHQLSSLEMDEDKARQGRSASQFHVLLGGIRAAGQVLRGLRRDRCRSAPKALPSFPKDI
jgi:hypothetical protein